MKTLEKYAAWYSAWLLTPVRAERAKQILRLGNTISDIALDTGFVDQAHFMRRFKAIMEVTPWQYMQRRMLGMIAEDQGRRLV
ncbi:helix-turn-helix domain-containing protein [Acidicapsa acidisoli]|uniref:helix-turn-helix domain-containing protein n=1 Tax=Acidicapsa acidisoli TaxID=1615681 RepID=UPI0021E01D6D|nr:helix-turn-helix domain-containing protein [Acidicapsa acidisoli]